MKSMKVGIGFATGRKSFKKVLRSYINNWKEAGLVDNPNVSLNVIVAYDLNYNNTIKSDYTTVAPELKEHIDDIIFIGKEEVDRAINELESKKIITHEQGRVIFGKGYAAQRNAVLYTAVKNKMDYLIFLDDDEYPVAVTCTRGTAVWGGQHVLSRHLEEIVNADITHGHHCGYISQIPYLEYNDILAEEDFRGFIEAVSNDILSWDSVKATMLNGGVTYADPKVLIENRSYEVAEINNAKFISGGNLGINLTNPERVFPFYNPPGARGEDTFLGTCLTNHKVIKVPCYTFHDGFSTYNHLLEGVLPIKLKFIKTEDDIIVTRFYNACMGWIRYKPLLMYVTEPETYPERVAIIKKKLHKAVPKLCSYFDRPEFMKLEDEFDKYSKDTIKHYAGFMETQQIWGDMMAYAASMSKHPLHP